jgi:hypothetical protein
MYFLYSENKDFFKKAFLSVKSGSSLIKGQYKEQHVKGLSCPLIEFFKKLIGFYRE